MDRICEEAGACVGLLVASEQFIQEIRKRLDAYFNLVLHNVRDTVRPLADGALQSPSVCVSASEWWALEEMKPTCRLPGGLSGCMQSVLGDWAFPQTLESLSV